MSETACAAPDGDEDQPLRCRIENARKRVKASPAVVQRQDTITKHLPPAVRHTSCCDSIQGISAFAANTAAGNRKQEQMQSDGASWRECTRPITKPTPSQSLPPLHTSNATRCFTTKRSRKLRRRQWTLSQPSAPPALCQIAVERRSFASGAGSFRLLSLPKRYALAVLTPAHKPHTIACYNSIFSQTRPGVCHRASQCRSVYVHMSHSLTSGFRALARAQ